MQKLQGMTIVRDLESILRLFLESLVLQSKLLALKLGLIFWRDLG